MKSFACWIALWTAAPLTAGEAEVIFDGKSTEGWVVEGAKTFKGKDGKPQPVWVVEDGLLKCQATGGGGFLRYDRPVRDFAFRVEYRFAAPEEGSKKKGNSGIGIRCPKFDPKRPRETRPSFGSYEVQLLDDAGTKPHKHGTASLYRYVAPEANVVKPAPQWNDIELTCVGPRIRVRMNGRDILDVDQTEHPNLKDKPLQGYVSLQCHGSKIDFRNIRLKETAPPK